MQRRYVFCRYYEASGKRPVITNISEYIHTRSEVEECTAKIMSLTPPVGCFYNPPSHDMVLRLPDAVGQRKFISGLNSKISATATRWGSKGYLVVAPKLLDEYINEVLGFFPTLKKAHALLDEDLTRRVFDVFYKGPKHDFHSTQDISDESDLFNLEGE